MNLTSLRCALVGLLLPYFTLATNETDWIQFRGPGGLGVSPDKNVPVHWSATTNLAWKTPLPGPGGSSPIVRGPHLFLTCYTGYAVPGATDGDLENLQRHVICLDRQTGRALWTNTVKAALPEQPKVRDHGYASSTMTADAERLYAFFGRSGVFAFDDTGRQLWQADVGSEVHGWGSATSPVLHQDLLIVNAGVESGSLVALSKKTGREVWRAGGIKESWNTPIFRPADGGKTEVILAIMGKVLSFDADTGTALWSCATGVGWYMVPSLVYAKDVVYCIGGRTGGALAVRTGGRGNVTDSHRLWTLKKGSNVPSPILHQGHLYWLHENLGIFYCVNAETGALVFEERLANAGQFYGSPILAGDKIYAVTRRGVTFVLGAQPTFAQLGRNELGDRSSFDASPIVDGSRLLIRSDRNLYCIAAP